MSQSPSSVDSIFTKPASSPDTIGASGRTYALLVHWLTYGCLGAGIFILVSTAYGILIQFSSIPYMDQWDGYIGFWEKLQSGDYSAWWRQHNEHRIVFSRALFWLDLRYFHGRNIFTVAVTGVLHAATAAVFVYAYLRSASRKYSLPFVVGIVLALRFSWIQGENFTWGFQSQFIAVYFFAMLAFLACSSAPSQMPTAGKAIAWAVLFGVLSSLSMTNGLLVLPLLVLQAILLGLSWRQGVPIVLATVAVWVLYFYGYASPPGHGNPLEGLRHHLLGVLWYFAVFMGGSISFVLPVGVGGATVVGLASLAGMVATGAVLRSRDLFTPYRSMLYLTYVFCALSGFLAALGRYNFGISTAAAARYNTPCLISWLCIALIFIDVMPVNWFRRIVLLLSLVVMPAFAAYQLKVNDVAARNLQYSRIVGMLGLKMHVYDTSYLDSLYPESMRPQLLALAQYAEASRVSIYGYGWVHDVGSVKFDTGQIDTKACSGSFEGIEAIANGYRVRGWASRADTPVHGHGLIVLTGAAGTTVGYGITGEDRPDVFGAMPHAGDHAGWRGFVSDARWPINAYFYDGQTFCPLANLVAFVPEQDSKTGS